MKKQNDETASNPFWDYSVTAYSRDEVAPICIELQDTFAMDVNLLLYAAWLAHLNRRLSQSHLSEVETRVADWREKVITPLRSLRRQLRNFPPAQEIREGTAIYYIAEFKFINEEWRFFEVDFRPQGAEQTYTFKLKHQLYIN